MPNEAPAERPAGARDEVVRLKTQTPSTSNIPTANDRPDDFRMAIREKGENSSQMIYRSKTVGEPPFMLAISVFCALTDAVPAAGDGKTFPDLDAPATPERVLVAVEQMREAAGASGAAAHPA